MNLKIKKIFKYILTGIISILLVLFIGIAIALNFIFTPKKITPKIVDAVNEKLDAELHLKSIELIYFSTFPNLTLEMKDGVILKKLNDSILTGLATKKDSLIAFHTGRITVNLTAFLLHKKIDLKHLLIEEPQIYAYVNKKGETNWNIMKEEVERDTLPKEKKANSFQANINIEDVTISNGNLYYDDENTELYASLEGLDLNLNAIYNQKTVLLDMVIDTENLIFWKKGDTLLDDLSFGLSTKLDLNRNNKVVKISKTKVRINDIELIANGQLVRNKEKKEVDMQLELTLEVPSLKTIVELIPEKILQKNKKFESKGSVALKAKVNGIYGNGKLPLLQGNLNIENGRISYKNMPEKIDLIETNMDIYLDPSKETHSYINISNFKIKGDGIDLHFTGKVEDVLSNSKVTAVADGSIKFSSLGKIFPLKEGVKLKGVLKTDINTTFYPKDLVNKNYGNINALGNITSTDVLFTYKTDSLIFEAKNIKAVFIKDTKSKLLTTEASKVLGGRIDLSGINLSIKNKIKASADTIFFEFGTTPLKDKTKIVTLTSKLIIDNAFFKLGDSIKGIVKKGNAQIKIEPSKNDRSIPSIHSDFSIDSTGITANGSFFAITDGNYNLDMIKKDKKKWPVTGQISFNKLYAFTPTFPLLLKMPQTKITLKPGVIELNHAKIELGSSDLVITGKIYDFEKTIFEGNVLKAELGIQSKLIDVNELIETLNKGVKLEDADIEELVAESQDIKTPKFTNPKTFVIPEGIDFKFNSSISRVLFKDHHFDNLLGLITIKDQVIDLKNLKIDFQKAKMTTLVRLTAKGNNENSLAFDFKLAHIDLGNLINLMPVMDSLLPMAKSFDGNVNFRIKGISKLSDKMGMIAPSIDAIARIEGHNLVVFDSKAFQSLSKKLMFKNKEKNTIDKISVEILIQNKVIEVLPAKITIDRYQFAVGGTNKLDMTYDYQVSILKSPLPFKAGVDIVGDADDFDIKLTKAKYKYIFSDKKRHQKKVDSTLIKRKLAILEQLPF